MGGATRLISLLAVPFPPLRPPLLRLSLRLSALSSSIRPLSFPKAKSRASLLAKSFHSQSNNYSYGIDSSTAQKQQPQSVHPWPEWSSFLHIISNRQEFCATDDNGIPPEDAFVVYEQLPDDFVRAAASCLAFARARPNLLGLLSRRDIEAVVSNGTPFLFKSALDTARRMRAFLDGGGNSASEVNQANTVDLMKYILSYASNPTVSSERSGLYSRELVDSSVRSLLHELSTVSCGAPTGYAPASQHHPVPGGQGVTSPSGQNIVMKRGDWICPKCKFMNFARNMKCLECEGPRPQRQLTGGEWKCPQCNFFNYGRNTVCLRCDCRRSGAPLFNTMNNNRSGVEYNGDFSYRTGTENRLVENEEKTRGWFSNNSQLNSEAFPETMPRQGRDQTSVMNYGKNAQETEVRDQKSVSSQSESSAENFQFPRYSLSEINAQKNDNEQAEKPEPQRWFKNMMELHDSKDLPNTISDDDFPAMPVRKGENRFVVSKNKDRSLSSPQYKRQVSMDQAGNTNFVPFVPFPPGYFARKDAENPNGPESAVTSASQTSSDKTKAETNGITDSSTVKSRNNERTGPTVNSQFSGEVAAPPAGNPVGNSFTSHSVNNNVSSVGYSEKQNPSQAATGGFSSPQPEGQNDRSGWTGKSLEGSAVTEPDPLDMSEEAKAERWFKRVAQIKDISELSQIPDEDFPSIMPMRKGVNRFVVSKRKTPLERRLTSQQYRRNLPIVRTDPVKQEGDNS